MRWPTATSTCRRAVSSPRSLAVLQLGCGPGGQPLSRACQLRLCRPQWIDSGKPAELNRMEASSVEGIVVHRDKLLDREVCVIQGMSVTTPARTAFDLGRQPGLTTAVIRLDALANATNLTPSDVERVAEYHGGSRGLIQLRQVLGLMDGGSESPPETPHPAAPRALGIAQAGDANRGVEQISVTRSRTSIWVIASRRSGSNTMAHNTGRTRRDGRPISTGTPELAELGWVIIRVSNDLLNYRPEVVVARVRAALQARRMCA